MQPGEIQAVEQLSPSPAADVPVAAQTSRLQWAFHGPNGLRAFWRLAIFVAVVFGLRFGISRVLHLLHLARPHPALADFSARTVLIQDGLAFLCVLAATAIMGAFEKRSLGDYGLPLRGAFGIRFFEGILWGFVAECATIFTLFFTGNVAFHGFDLTGSAALQYALLWAAAFVMVGFFEEFLFRGYPQFTLATGIGFWPAAFLLSGLFWLGHMGNPGETWIGGLATALAALVFCVFGVADSGMPANGHLLNTTLTGNKWMTGGTVGPEGSVVELVVVSAVIGLLFVRFGREKQRLTAPLS